MASIEDPPQQLLTVQVGTTDLAAYLANIAQQINRHGRLMGNLTEELRACRTSIDQLKLNTHESISRMQKTVTGHETQLRVAVQQADASVSNSQFAQATLQLKEKLRALESKVDVGGPGKSLKEMMDESIRDWQEKEGNSSMSNAVQDSVNDLREALEKKVSTLAEQVTQDSTSRHREVSAIVNSIRDETARNKRTAADDVQMLKDLVADTEKKVEDDMTKVKNSVAASVSQCATRITNFYKVMSIPEPDVQEGAGDQRSSSAVPSQTRLAPTVTEPTSTAVVSSTNESTTSPTTSQSTPEPTKQKEEPQENHSQAKAVPSSPVVAVSEAEKSKAVLQTPLFISLRHQILNDIAERVGTSTAQQSEDFDSEMSDVRKELKQHTTAHRVIELINQYADTDTPLKVQSILKRLDELDDDKVSTSSFVEALRGKSDVVVVDTKADRAQVTEFVDSFKMQMTDVMSNLGELNAERQEFREILRDVLYMHKRANVQQSAMVSQLGVDATSPRALFDGSGKLPTLTGSEPQGVENPQAYPPSTQGIDPRPPPPPETSPRPMLREGPPSRQGGRTPNNKRSIKPLTDHRAVHTPNSVPGSTTPNGTKRQWTPRSSMGPHTDVVGSDAGSVVPMTQSQRAYAQAIAGGGGVTPTGPPTDHRVMKPSQSDKVHSPADTTLPPV